MKMITEKIAVKIFAVILVMASLLSCAKNTNVVTNVDETTKVDNTTDVIETTKVADNKTLDYDKIEYLGHGSLKLYLRNGKICYIDPYAGDDYKENADLILITHEHMDHNKIDLITQNPDCKIIRSTDWVVNGESMEYNTFDIYDMHIEPVQAYNQNHKVSECVGYVITSNGKKIYVAGDTSKTDQMSKLSSYNIDYAFLPMDGKYNMDIDEAIECENIIKAKHTIPYHMAPGELFNEDRASSFKTLTTLIMRPNDIIEINGLGMNDVIRTEEREVLNNESGNVLRGTFYFPKTTTQNKYPLIISSHELGGNAEMPWWKKYAEHFANEGIAVFAFDFAGGGEKSRSDGKTTDMSVLTEASDLQAVLDAAKNWEGVDKDKIIICGGSQGGGVASIVASENADDLMGLMLLYPAFYLPDDLHKKYPDINNLPEVDRRNNMIDIGPKYILDMYDYDYFANLPKFEKPVLIVHGDEDKTAPIEYSERAVNEYKNAKLYVIKGAGHIFLKEDQQDEFLGYADEYLKTIGLVK